MRIVMLRSSPHPHGSSNMLGDSFAKGAKEKGHEVIEFDVAKLKVGPCLGCDHCYMNGPCVQKDDMENKIKPAIMKADLLAFVTPLYYFGMSAQLKAVVDRFYSFNGSLSSKRMKAILIVASWNSDSWTMKDIKSHYETLCRYLSFNNLGEILGTGCGSPSMTSHSPFMDEAYRLGRSI